MEKNRFQYQGRAELVALGTLERQDSDSRSEVDAFSVVVMKQKDVDGAVDGKILAVSIAEQRVWLSISGSIMSNFAIFRKTRIQWKDHNLNFLITETCTIKQLSINTLMVRVKLVVMEKYDFQ